MKRSTLIIFACLISSSLHAQNGLLWKIEHPKTGESGFVFGTMHLIPKDEFKPSQVLDSVIQTSDKIVTEIGIDLFLEERFDLATSMVFENRTSLKDHLPEEKMARLKRVLIDTLKMDKSRLEHQYFNLKPLFFSTILLQELIGATETYDAWIWKKAKAAEKETGALESVYQQIGYIDSISMQEQLTWLDDLNSNMLADYLYLLHVYNRGRLDSLLVLSEMTTNSAADIQLRTLRNQNWIPRMRKHLAEGKTLFAVGALHLPGAEGLLELLRKEGFLVDVIPQ